MSVVQNDGSCCYDPLTLGCHMLWSDSMSFPWVSPMPPLSAVLTLCSISDLLWALGSESEHHSHCLSFELEVNTCFPLNAHLSFPWWTPFCRSWGRRTNPGSGCLWTCLNSPITTLGIDNSIMIFEVGQRSQLHLPPCSPGDSSRQGGLAKKLQVESHTSLQPPSSTSAQPG